MSQTKAQLIDAVDGSIVTADLADDAVNADKLASNSVVSASIVDGSIVTADLADDAVNADKLASNSVVSASIVDGSIVNADINASAAIAGSKIDTSTFTAPITITHSTPAINFTESDANPDWRISNSGGVLRIEDVTGGYATKLSVNTDGHIDIHDGLDVTGGGLDVTGNITGTGNVTLPDNGELVLGSSNDLILRHIPGSRHEILGGASAQLQVRCDEQLFLSENGNEYLFKAIKDGSVELYHDGDAHASTESYGFKVKHTNDSGLAALKLENNSTANNQVPRFDILVDLANGKNGGSVQFVRGNNYQSSAAADSEIVINPAKNDSNIEIVRITQDYVRLHSNSSGIQFNSDTAAANALNDYEEGTWTPNFDDAYITSPGTTYNSRAGKYIKIGKMVLARFHVNFAGVGNSGAGPFIGTHGLPFTPDTSDISGRGMQGSLYISGPNTPADTVNVNFGYAKLDNGNYYLGLSTPQDDLGSTNARNIQAADITNGDVISGTVMYIAS